MNIAHTSIRNAAKYNQYYMNVIRYYNYFTNVSPKRNMSTSMDHIIVVRLDMLRRVAPDLLMKNGIIEYVTTLTIMNPI
jgi:hypothetical protein